MNNENSKTRKLNEVIDGADTDSLPAEADVPEPLSDESLGTVAGGAGLDPDAGGAGANGGGKAGAGIPGSGGRGGDGGGGAGGSSDVAIGGGGSGEIIEHYGENGGPGI